MTTTTIPARPKKLRSGEWGAWVETPSVRKGDRIKVTTRAGKSWSATVDKVIWTGSDGAIVATDSGGGSSRSRSRQRCDECWSAPGTIPATDSSGIPGMVCGSCYGPSFELSFA